MRRRWTTTANAPHFHQYAIGGLYQKMLERQLENLTAVC